MNDRFGWKLYPHMTLKNDEEGRLMSAHLELTLALARVIEYQLRGERDPGLQTLRQHVQTAIWNAEKENVNASGR